MFIFNKKALQEFLINSAYSRIISFMNASPVLSLCDISSLPLCLNPLFYYFFLPLALSAFYSPFPGFPSFPFSMTSLGGNSKEPCVADDSWGTGVVILGRPGGQCQLSL